MSARKRGTEAVRALDMDRLRKSLLFAELTDQSMQRLTVDATEARFARGDLIVKQGDVPRHVHVVLEGQVGLIGQATDGEETVVELFEAGDVFIAPAVILHLPYLMSVRAIEAASVALIPADAYRAALRDDHKLALASTIMLAHHWRRLIRQIKDLKLKTATQRLGSYLTSLTPQRTGASTVQVDGERRLLARRLGMTPESLSRAFASLRELGVTGRGKRIEIADVAQLRAYCLEDGLI